MNKIEVEIMGLSSSPSSGGAYALLLKEVNGNRRLPIIIGAFEAQAIALELEGIIPARPLTHDLIKNLITNLSAEVSEIIIDELRDNTFYAKITLELSGFSNQVDSRPSDAIALAVRTKSPIFVAESVMINASFVPEDEEEEEETKDFLEDEIETDEPEIKSTGKLSLEGKIAILEEQLRELIEKEDYERAAVVRDEINRLKRQSN